MSFVKRAKAMKEKNDMPGPNALTLQLTKAQHGDRVREHNYQQFLERVIEARDNP